MQMFIDGFVLTVAADDEHGTQYFVYQNGGADGYGMGRRRRGPHLARRSTKHQRSNENANIITIAATAAVVEASVYGLPQGLRRPHRQPDADQLSEDSFKHLRQQSASTQTAPLARALHNADGDQADVLACKSIEDYKHFGPIYATSTTRYGARLWAVH